MNAVRLLRLGTLVAIALGVTASPVSAAGSVESRWWSTAPLFAAPDVTSGQLLVQGGADATQPFAYAGISVGRDDAEAPEKIVLTVAPGSATTPGANLALCKLLGPAMTDTPPGFDCAEKVEAAPAADGGSYEFALAPLLTSGSLDLALVPTKATDRVVLEQPTADALRTSSRATAAGPPPQDAGGIGADGGGPPDPGGFSAGVATFDLPPLPAPAVTVPARGPEPGAIAGPAPTLLASTARSGAGHGPRSSVPLIFFGLSIAAAAFWGVAGRGSEDPTLDAGVNR